MTVPPESVLGLRRGVGFRRIENEGVVLVSETSQAIVLNETGTRVLELLDRKRSVSEILAVLEAEFEVLHAQLSAEVTSFLEKALDAKIVELVKK